MGDRVNRGKQFEGQIESALHAVEDTAVIRLYDPQGGYAGVSNICDFIAYHYPTQFILECKSCYGNTLSIHSNSPKNLYGAISNTQWTGMLDASAVDGVTAGVLVWFIDHDVTLFYPIQTLQSFRLSGKKSVNIRTDREFGIEIPGTKKRILFEYDLEKFIKG